MKQKQILVLIIFLAITTIIFYGCSKDSNNPVDTNNVTGEIAKLTLNGGGFSNKQITLGNGACQFSPTDTVTYFEYAGKVDSDSMFLSFAFPGNTSGNYSWTPNVLDVVFAKKVNNSYEFYVPNGQGSTNITSFGAVNGKVTGTISGKLVKYNDTVTVNISGNFSALRIADGD